MMNNYLQGGFFNPFWPYWALLVVPVVIAVVVWSLFWKGLALWTAARNGHKWWFIALLVINTVGILEILYLFVFSKKMRK